MIYDFENNIGMMIHFRRDVDDRYRNLEMVLNFYRKNVINFPITIVNDDTSLDRDMKTLCEKYDCRGLFMENSGVYWRTKAFNEASKGLNCRYIIAGDTDVIIDPKFILEASKIIENDPKVGIVYPYNGMFVHLKDKMFKKFQSVNDVSPMVNEIDTLEPKPYHQTENFLVAHPQSKGGMVMFDKLTYMGCNGYNPKFRGWGYEDDEILARFQKFGYSVERVEDLEAIAWHLPHDNTIREKHEFYDENRKNSDFVCLCEDLGRLKLYVATWEI